MAEFIGRPRESQLAGLIAQMQARRSDPIAQGILQAGQAIGGGISAMGQRSAEADRIEKARLASESGRREGGIMELLGKGGTFSGPGGTPADLATLLPGIVPQGMTYTAPQERGAIKITPEILVNYPQIQKMGYAAGDMVPANVFNAQTQPVKDDTLSDAEMKMFAKSLKVKPEELVGMRRDMVKALLPQAFIDPETGAVTEGPKGAKMLPKAKLPTEGERLTRGFADRAQQSQDELIKIMEAGYDPGAVFTTRGEYVPNFMKTEQTQQAEQAMRNFVSAVLRKESGAAIPIPELLTETRKYFPMPGDKPETIAQKGRAREQAIKNLVAGAGKAPSTYTKPEKKGGASDVDSLIDKHLGGL